MKLLRLQAQDFRNLGDISLTFGDRFNVFYGDNGQGKTNLLEAIFLLGTMKSFRMAKNPELIGWGQATAVVRGSVDKEGVEREIYLVIERQTKRVRVDRKTISRLSDFFGSLNVVVFSPEDLAMVKGAPESRRRYLDRAVFSSDASYLKLYHDYARILKNRNSLLKSGDAASLPVWDEQLADTGARLMAKRIAYLDEVTPLFREFYREIAGNGEEAAISYAPHHLDRSGIATDARNLIIQALRVHALEERRRATTVVGPHRDDLEFILNAKLLRHHGSQGQQRSLILALKMAEIEHLRKKFRYPPVLLLDDMTSELDGNRNRNLMEFLEHHQMQVFITTTRLDNILLDDIEKYPAFRIEAGKVVQERHQ